MEFVVYRSSLDQQGYFYQAFFPQQPDRESLVMREGIRSLPFLPWPMRESQNNDENLIPLETRLPRFTPPKHGQAQQVPTMEDPVYGLQVGRVHFNVCLLSPTNSFRR